MLILEPRSRARFTQEARDSVLIGERRGLHELDREELAEVEVPRRDDDAHTALPEHVLYAIFTQ
jgi:hypothetical protein